MDKKTSHVARYVRARKKIQELGVNRLVVHRTPRHIYAQVINPEAQVLAVASTVEKRLKSY